ncbi:hypothetical protein GLOIN_2v1765309 [Rhizophagus irregularis DAOM 181602=DAOM 197198]|nr:hypothetical protein GLOIN_2v1765309 [Rhizophagus irregularis DAOM 181602=DAOM 197198]
MWLPPNTTSHLQPCDAGIINSFKHGNLPISETGEIDEIKDHASRDEMELQDLISKLPFDDPMDADEFLRIDDCLKSNEGLTDDAFVSMVKSNNNNEPEVDPNEVPPVVISVTKALGYLDDFLNIHRMFVLIQMNQNVLQKLRHQVLKSHINNSKQTTLDSFFQTL